VSELENEVGDGEARAENEAKKSELREKNLLITNTELTQQL
jgi:hypothetical protein